MISSCYVSWSDSSPSIGRVMLIRLWCNWSSEDTSAGEIILTFRVFSFLGVWTMLAFMVEVSSNFALNVSWVLSFLGPLFPTRLRALVASFYTGISSVYFVEVSLITLVKVFYDCSFLEETLTRVLILFTLGDITATAGGELTLAVALVSFAWVSLLGMLVLLLSSLEGRAMVVWFYFGSYRLSSAKVTSLYF